MIKRTNFTLIASLVTMAVLVAGCEDTTKPDTPMAQRSPGHGGDLEQAPRTKQLTPGRVDVTRIGIIYDELAYGSRRGIYTIYDRETGKEFIGISGIGITETGSHKSGKSTKTDER